MSTTIDDETRERLAAAFASPDLTLCAGLGYVSGGPDAGERCTIAEIHMVLTGTLSDGPHDCMSNVVRRWVIRVQDAMPDGVRNSAEWRAAAVGIAGSAAAPEVEERRRALLLDWMWERLADEAVLEAVPESARPAWDRMLAERTREAATEARKACAYADAAADGGAAAAYAAAAAAVYAAAVSAAAVSAAAVSAAADAADAVSAAAADAADAVSAAAYADARREFWARANPAATLTRLIAA